MIIYFDGFEQLSDEWFEIKKGKISGSNATPIGANGKGLETYCKKICLELSGVKAESFTSIDMERGNLLESSGRMAYELDKGVDTYEVAFVTNSLYENSGVSPDSLIGTDGGLEIKARNDEKHFSLICGDEKEIPKNQIQMCLMITERKWWDFVSYNPNLSKPLFIKRIFPDLKYHEKLKAGIIKGNELTKEYSEMYNQY